MEIAEPKEICEWYPHPKRVRYMHVMSHPGWPDLVRVGRRCAKHMGDRYASLREREFRRDPVNWRARMDDDEEEVPSHLGKSPDRPPLAGPLAPSPAAGGSFCNTEGPYF
jgi:hypothetical protein